MQYLDGITLVEIRFMCELVQRARSSDFCSASTAFNFNTQAVTLTCPQATAGLPCYCCDDLLFFEASLEACRKRKSWKLHVHRLHAAYQ
jgi:hypothetical protein